MGKNRIRVLGRDITVILGEPVEGAAGHFRPTAGEIAVNKDLDKFERKDTLIHELLHAILYQQGYTNDPDEEERYVRPLATGLAAVLQDNPGIAKWLAAPNRRQR